MGGRAVSAEKHVRVRVTLPDGTIDPLVWCVVLRRSTRIGDVLELAAAGRRLVVPVGWATVTEEPAASLRRV